ncbi:MAG: pentapeptide repeat-containing protein [Armatimonadota bacterium]
MLKSPWVLIAGIVVVIALVLTWLLTRRDSKLKAWINEPVEPDKPRWTYALTPFAAALAPLAAFSVMLPNYFNQQQTDRKFMAESEKTRTDATWQRLNLETLTQSSEFNEIESRLASPDDKTRAVAALQLADLAVRPKPSASGDAFDNDNYPFFLRTGTQMAVALGMEQSPEVRAAYREALRKMIAFADTNENAAWQYGLANQLADANRRVTRTFVESLGRYGAVNDTRQASTLQALATVAPFATPMDTTIIGLRDLLGSEGFQASRRVGARLRNAEPGDQRVRSDAALLSTVQANALRVMDTRDALADSLRTLKPIAEAAATATAPVPALALPLSLPGATPKAAAPVPTLKLQNCYLAGANLWEAHLTGADVSGTSFMGANLKHADLTGVNLRTAMRLPSSVTKAGKGPDAADIPALKLKYPRYDWASVEARTQTPKKAESAPAPGNSSNPPGASVR